MQKGMQIKTEYKHREGNVKQKLTVSLYKHICTHMQTIQKITRNRENELQERCESAR